MSIQITISSESEALLRQRAAAVGQELEAYVSKLVQQFADPPLPLEQLSGDIYRRFVESGMSEEELAEELERAKHEMRAERRAREGR